MRTLRKLSPLAIVPAYAWLLLSTLMAGLSAAAAAPVAAGLDASYGLVICSEGEPVALDGTGQPSEPQELPSRHCQWCQSFGKTGPLLPPEIVLSAAFAARGERVPLPVGTEAPTSAPRLSFYSRAPPLSLA